MIVQYTMRQNPHPLYRTDSRRVDFCGQFDSWEAFGRFKLRELGRGWIVDHERASGHVPEVQK